MNSPVVDQPTNFLYRDGKEHEEKIAREPIEGARQLCTQVEDRVLSVELKSSQQPLAVNESVWVKVGEHLEHFPKAVGWLTTVELTGTVINVTPDGFVFVLFGRLGNTYKMPIDKVYRTDPRPPVVYTL